jgi:hypothetical protein
METQKQKRLKILKEFDGCEVWTDCLGKRFDERVCCGIEYPYVWANGIKFKPTLKEINGIIQSHLED